MTTQNPTVELARALTCYSRLASPPQWTEYPVVADVDATRAALRKAWATSDRWQAARLNADLDREYRREAIRGDWQGRSAAAWDAIHLRLWSARCAALATGALQFGSQEDRLVLGRIRDAQSRRNAARARFGYCA